MNKTMLKQIQAHAAAEFPKESCGVVIREAGLKSQLHAYGTNIEGDWDEVMAAVKRCHEVVHAMGAPRITTSIRLGTRTDREQSMEDKISSVERALGEDASAPRS